MSDNYESWEKEVDGVFRVDLPELAADAVAALGLEAIGVAMAMTPVKDGRARGNWQLTLDRPAEGEVDRDFPGDLPAGVPDPTVMDEAQAVLATMEAPQDVWLHNGLVYIEVLNNGGTNRTAHQMLEGARAAVQARIGGGGE
jgi:hypothetical protein